MPINNEAVTRNSQRAVCGEAAVKVYASVKEHNTTDYFDFASENPQERLTDLLVDLRHWARSNNLVFADADRIADSHFECELDEEAEGGDGP